MRALPSRLLALLGVCLLPWTASASEAVQIFFDEVSLTSAQGTTVSFRWKFDEDKKLQVLSQVAIMNAGSVDLLVAEEPLHRIPKVSLDSIRCSLVRGPGPSTLSLDFECELFGSDGALIKGRCRILVVEGKPEISLLDSAGRLLEL